MSYNSDMKEEKPIDLKLKLKKQHRNTKMDATDIVIDTYEVYWAKKAFNLNDMINEMVIKIMTLKQRLPEDGE